MNSSSFVIYPEPFCSVGFLILAIGVFFNLLIICGTCRKESKLRSKSNYLICILAVFDLATAASFMQISVQVWVGWVFVSNSACFYASGLQIFFMNTGTALIGAMAFDRLIMLKWPLSYKSWSSKNYLLAMTSVALMYSLLILCLGFIFCTPEVSVPVCMPPSALHGPANLAWVFTNLLLSIIVIATQAATYKISKTGETRNEASTATSLMLRRLGQSILIVTGVYACSWATTVVVLAALSLLRVSPSVLFHGSLYVGWGAFVNVSCNGIIYGWRSKDYRREFLAVLGVKQARVASHTTGSNF